MLSIVIYNHSHSAVSYIVWVVEKWGRMQQNNLRPHASPVLTTPHATVGGKARDGSLAFPGSLARGGSLELLGSLTRGGSLDRSL